MSADNMQSGQSATNAAVTDHTELAGAAVNQPHATTPAGTAAPQIPVHRNTWWVTLGLAAVAVLIAVGSFLLAAPAPEGEEAFAGADGTSEEIVAEVNPDYEPWFSPLFEVESTEVESGIFAAQAAVGAGFIGYVLGRMRSRRS